MKQEIEIPQRTVSALVLCRFADQILAEAGLDIFGRKDSSYEQRRFEHKMKTGAYCSQREQ